MTAVLLIAVIFSPLGWLALAFLGAWLARTGVLTLKRPPRPPAPKEPADRAAARRARVTP